MNKRQGLAAAAQSVRDPPTEPRAVDRHDGVGAKRSDRRHGFAHSPQDKGRPRQYFSDSHDRELIERNKTIETLILHALAANTGDPEVSASALPQRRDQLTPERVAGRFTGYKENEERFRRTHDRRMPTRNSPA
jgi:hypothetical protein